MVMARLLILMVINTKENELMGKLMVKENTQQLMA